MLVEELVERLKAMPRDAMLVFEDAAEEDFSYEDVVVELNADGEVIIRVV